MRVRFPMRVEGGQKRSREKNDHIRSARRHHGHMTQIRLSDWLIQNGLRSDWLLLIYQHSTTGILINYFLSFLFLTGFISDAIQFKHFLWFRFELEDHDVYMMNLYWKELTKTNPNDAFQHDVIVYFGFRGYMATDYVGKVFPQVAQARNMSIGEHRHLCVTFEI